MTLFTLLSIPWKPTPKSWQFIPTRIVFCLILSFIFLRDESISPGCCAGGAGWVVLG
ncbi:MAG TPA: hypothetical protein VI451_17780 [Anaerolineales bacterium]|nr:hypothetical protein [Anaerolineales bacterium]